MQSCLRLLKCGGSNEEQIRKDSIKKQLMELDIEKQRQVPKGENRSGLTPKQVFLLAMSWKAVMRKELDTGVDIFER